MTNFKLGKLYSYPASFSIWSKPVYFFTKAKRLQEIPKKSLFVILEVFEHNNIQPVFKILSNNGISGWAQLNQNFLIHFT
jgi:hypothetical protein